MLYSFTPPPPTKDILHDPRTSGFGLTAQQAARVLPEASHFWSARLIADNSEKPDRATYRGDGVCTMFRLVRL